MSIDEKTLSLFFKESNELLKDLEVLGESLKKVRMPNQEEANTLSEFAQKLNRLIGGAAAVGFEKFSSLSRKTSILAENCAEIKEITIKILVLNLNLVVSVLSEGFSDKDSTEKVEKKIPELEKRINICLASIGIKEPHIMDQEKIDKIIEQMKKEDH